MKHSIMLFALLFVVPFAVGQDLPSVAQAGGPSTMSGHYVYSSTGQLDNGNTYFETGIILSDGHGHWKLCGVGTYNTKTGEIPNGVACDKWTYTMSNYIGHATSDVGDDAFFFCTANGTVCQMTSHNVGWSWTARIEKEVAK